MSDHAPQGDQEAPPPYGPGLPIAAVLSSHSTLARVLEAYDPVYTASLVAGLLTEPALQSNCVRLEALVHLALIAGAGKKKPTPRAIGTWFEEMGKGPCAAVEDPAEDAFATVITTSQGNFRILEGTWESATFYLQRVVNAVENSPGNAEWISLRESVRAMLKLSELMCERSELTRYTFGSATRERQLPRPVERITTDYRSRVCFNKRDLARHGIALEALEPFVFQPSLRDSIPDSTLIHSPLLYHPLLVRSGQVVVAMPTALSIAIRGLVIGNLVRQPFREFFLNVMAKEYEDYFRSHPTLGMGFGAPLSFQPTDHGIMASGVIQVDVGRWVQLIFVLDTLEGFEETYFAGANADPKAIAGDIDKWVDSCRSMASKKPHFRRGLTIIVGCGIGRSTYHHLNSNPYSDWRRTYLSAPDAATLSELREYDNKDVWRILDAKECLAALGVKILNLSGLLNLIAWVRSLDGHLVPHDQVPVEWREGHGTLVIDPAMILKLRRDAALKLDRHAVPRSDGVWVEARKTGDSLFAEGRDAPVYLPTQPEKDGQLPIVYEGKRHHWWCRVVRPHEYTQWSLISTWIARIAPVLESRLKSLPAIISIDVAFNGQSSPYGDHEVTVEQAAIEADIQVTVDRKEMKLTVAAGDRFEEGLRHPENIAEVALVASIVRGCIDLSDGDQSDAEPLVRAIVLNASARDCHAFHAQGFRDFVRDQLQDHPVVINEIDAATLRLGLGWKARLPSEGEQIEGRMECNAFLNSLVLQLEDELCQDLRNFNRHDVILLALRNHELAMARQATWRRTASAILGLRSDRASTVATFAEQQGENNAALQASRVLVEVAVCECPLQGGLKPGNMDLSRLMAQLMQLTELGDWSDAIAYGGMAPSIEITPLGDILIPTGFRESIVKPFGDVVVDEMVETEVSRYAQHFKAPETTESVDGILEPQFIAAWQHEKPASLDSFRRFVDDIEDLGVDRQSPVLALPRSELINSYRADEGAAEKIVASLSMLPRSEWRKVPDGMVDKDRQPWRYRRELSLLRLPIIQLDESADPLTVVAPGLLRDSVNYMMRNYYGGYFPQRQLKSPEMRAWAGVMANRRGGRFSEEVAVRMRALGWNVKREVKVSEVLGKGVGRNFGDVDVLAWSATTSRVLLIECKDLHFHKTAGEIAEQLSDFRGEVRDGKRDLLRKHLDRIETLQADVARVAKYLHFKSPIAIEGWVVFRNPVPMLFATAPFGDTVRAATFAQLAEL